MPKAILNLLFSTAVILLIPAVGWMPQRANTVPTLVPVAYLPLIARIYSWILFPDLSHASSRTFVLVSGSLGGTVGLEPVYLDLNGSVCP